MPKASDLVIEIMAIGIIAGENSECERSRLRRITITGRLKTIKRQFAIMVAHANQILSS